jgi:hypothetical protein
MKIPTLVTIIILFATANAVANFLNFNLLSLLILASLGIGFFMAPIRAYQAATGKFYDRIKIPENEVKRTMRWFYAAIPFWLGLCWTAWNVGIIKSCSGDTCLGYSLLAIPFPFVYASGEISLFISRRKSERSN